MLSLCQTTYIYKCLPARHAWQVKIAAWQEKNWTTMQVEISKMFLLLKE